MSSYSGVRKEVLQNPRADVTQTGVITDGVTVNGRSGTIRTVALATALGAATDTFIVTNSYATIDSTILLSVTAYEGDGTPVLAVEERGNGNFSLRIGAAGAALTAPATISYLILP